LYFLADPVRFGHACATFIPRDGKPLIIAAGGNDGERVLSSVEFYSVCTDEWRPGPTLNKPRFQFPLSVVERIPTVFGAHSIEELRSDGWKEIKLDTSSEDNGGCCDKEKYENMENSTLISVPCFNLHYSRYNIH